MMTLLQIVQNACGELGLVQPQTVITAQDQQTIQMLALINRSGVDLCRQFQWERLDTEALITTVASTQTISTTLNNAQITIQDTSQVKVGYGVLATGVPAFATIVSIDSTTLCTLNMPCISTNANVTANLAQVMYPLPGNWSHSISDTNWDRTNRWPLVGAQSPQDWQSFKSGIVYAGPRLRFRYRGNMMELNPLPANGLELAFEYISKDFVELAAGGTASSFQSDNDTNVFDDSLMIAALKMRFKQAKGLDFSFEGQEYALLLEQCKSQDQPARTMSIGTQNQSALISNGNIPDGNWSQNV
jgi:hypothetical protein